MSATLLQDVVDRVAEAERAGTPIEYGLGPCSDRRAKRALALKVSVHQSEICAAINQAIRAGLIVRRETGEIPVHMGERTKFFPVIALFSATS